MTNKYFFCDFFLNIYLKEILNIYYEIKNIIMYNLCSKHESFLTSGHFSLC